MERFKIEVKETLIRVVDIEADSIDDAFSKVREMYRDEEIVLDSDDYVDTEFIEVES